MSVVIPVYNEGEAIVPCLDRILAGVTLPCEVLVVYDDDDRHHCRPLRKVRARPTRAWCPCSTRYGPGPARRSAAASSTSHAPVVVVTMADGSDDAEQIDELCKLVDRGVVVAAASRYMSGGQQIGGPMLKSPALAPRRAVAVLVRPRRHP